MGNEQSEPTIAQFNDGSQIPAVVEFRKQKEKLMEDNMIEMIDFSSALQRAFDLGDKAATAQYEAQNRPNILEHDGATCLYFNGKLTQIEPAEIYHPETFYASTLEGLCDYIQADSDEQFVTGQPAPSSLLKALFASMFMG